MEFTIENVAPSAEEYCHLRKLCGLSPKDPKAAEIGLKRSLFAVSVRTSENRLVAMGRVIGDLGCHVQIADIAVHPAFQKQGLSRNVMDRIMEFIKSEVPNSAFINLFADVDYLYQKYGFEYPTSKGMYLPHR